MPVSADPYRFFMKRKRIDYKRVCILFLVLATAGLASCSVNKKMTVAATAGLLESIATSSSRQSDLTVIREGMPAYLMLLDGMVEAWPENAQLLLAAAQTYASFASVSGKDADANIRLYRKATDYAVRALNRRGLQNPRETTFADFEKALDRMDKNDVPYLFWAASCWGNWIGANLNSMEAMAELPRVELMMKRVLALDEGFYYGSPHLFMGIWFAMRPKVAGGDLDKARHHFQRAIALGKGRFLMANIYYAEYYGKRTLDKDLYVSILTRTLETPADIVPDLTLLNTVAHRRAETMLEEADAFF
jgi:hypothetical protein